MNIAHERQSRPDAGLDFTVEVLQTFPFVTSSLRCGPREAHGGQCVQSFHTLCSSMVDLHAYRHPPYLHAPSSTSITHKTCYTQDLRLVCINNLVDPSTPMPSEYGTFKIVKAV